TRPGAIPYLFRAGDSTAALVGRLRAHGWCGQIIGPHGSGKSTLIAALRDPIAQAGRRSILITLHDQERSLRNHRPALAELDAGSLLIVDGYEQLAVWRRWRLRRLCRRRGAGLLVTAHASAGLPLLYETCVQASTAEGVFTLLTAGDTR